MSVYQNTFNAHTIEYRAKLCCAASCPETVAAIQMLRRRLFVDRLGWTLKLDGEREVDQFDTADAVHCGVYRGPDLIGCFRAIPTERPYLANTVFPELAIERAYPKRRDVWEISRLGYLSDGDPETGGRVVYAVMLGFAQLVRATALVALVDLCHERLLKRLGIRTRRYGPPQPIGFDRFGRTLRAVAGEIPMHDQAAGFRELVSLLSQVEIDNVAHVFRSDAVSA